MALMLRDQAHRVIAALELRQLSAFSPPSSTGWRAKLRPARALAANQRAVPTSFELSRHQAASVGILSRSRRIQLEQPPWQRPSDFAERCAWKR
jgi:hypothetical protein